MRLPALLLAAVLIAPANAAAPVNPMTRNFSELPPGRYAVALTGLISTVCGRAVAAEWAKLPEIESARVDFDKSTAIIAVRIDRTVRVSSLRKTLRRAEKLANLGGRYDIRDISYLIAK